MPLKVVLVHPVIPQNTGNIARLTAAAYAELHLIEPLGFQLTDYYLRRAGLDYWPEVKLTVHKSWAEFLDATGAQREQLWFFSSHGMRSYVEAEYRGDDFLCFGSETKGLPPEYHEQYSDRMIVIPMDNPNIRSLNLSNSASIGLFEARRQLGMLGVKR